MLFQLRENTVLLSLGFEKLEGLKELMHTLNAPEDEVRLGKKRMGSARLPIRLRCMVP